MPFRLKIGVNETTKCGEMYKDEGIKAHQNGGRQGSRTCNGILRVGRLTTVRVSRTLLIVQELCESRGGRPGLSVLTSLLVSVDVKLY